jgi:DNA polymerase-3 subunit alpha
VSLGNPATQRTGCAAGDTLRLERPLEILGLAGVRRAIYKAGASYKIGHDERLVPDLEAAVGAGNVRLLGQRGATARVEASPVTESTPGRRVASRREPEPELEIEPELDDDLDEL